MYVDRAPVWDNTATYEAFMGRWSRPVADAVLAWLAPPDGLSWLDVGCGTGALTQAILTAADPREVLDLDPSADYIASANRQIIDPRVRFAVADARALPVPAGACEVVVAGLVLNFVPDPQLAVHEMARAARPGGTVAAYLWNPSGERQFTRYLWRAATELDPAAAAHDPVRLAPLGPAELSALWVGAFLGNVRVDELEIPIVFRDFDDYWQPQLLPGSSPAQRFLGSVDEEQRRALRARVQAMLPITGNGSVPLAGHVWAVRGTA